MKSFIQFLILMFLMSCKNNPDKDIFQNEYLLNHETLITEEHLYDPWEIEITDSLIILANKEGEPIIETYDFQGRLKQKFLSKGNGPFEIVTANGIQRGDNSNDIYVYDLFKRRHFHYDLNTQKINKPDTIIDFQPYQKDSILLFESVLMINNGMLAESRQSNGRIILMDRQGNFKRYGGEFPPKFSDKLSDYENTDLYHMTMTYNKNNNKLATATHVAGLLDIFDLSNDTIKHVWGKNDFLPQNIKLVEIGDEARVAFTRNSKFGYTTITSSSNYIYALYSGKLFNEPNYEYGNMIKVFNWKGDKGLCIHTDMYLRDITVDKMNNYIYAIADNGEGEPEIVKYDIREIVSKLRK